MKHSRQFGVVCLVLATLFWSFTGIFVKHFSLQSIDADVQNLFRYLAATTALWLLVLTAFRAEAIRALRRWWVFLLPAAVNCAFQVTQVSSLYHKSIYPGLMSLLTKSSVVFAVILAFIFFREERRTILSRRYLAGCALGVAGVLGVVMFADKARADFGQGVALIILSAFLWACYTLAMKHVVKDTRPNIAFAVVAVYTTLFFAVLTPIRSRPGQFLEVSTLNQILIVVSGVVCIAAAHSLYFRAVERLGVAICASFLLVQPLFIGALSWLFFGETLNPVQILMGGVLLAGAWLVIRAGRGEPANVRPAT